MTFRFYPQKKSAIPLLQRAIKDACADFNCVHTKEEADDEILLKDFHEIILSLVDSKLDEEDKNEITMDMLKTELFRNNLFSTKVVGAEGLTEVWYLKKNIPH